MLFLSLFAKPFSFFFPEKIKEMINLIISSYEKFFINLNSYNYKDFKEKAELMALN